MMRMRLVEIDLPEAGDAIERLISEANHPVSGGFACWLVECQFGAWQNTNGCLLNSGIGDVGEASRTAMEVCHDELVANLGGAGSYGRRLKSHAGYLPFADSVATADRVIN